MDAVNEERIMKAWTARYWSGQGRVYEKLYHTGRYKLDYALYFAGGKLAGMVEVKKREKFYDTVIMDLSKAMEFERYFRLGLQMIFLIEVPEGIFHHKWDTRSSTLMQWPRHHISRTDVTDNGPVIDIPKSTFVEIGSSYTA
jgi:hypothetical protein